MPEIPADFSPSPPAMTMGPSVISGWCALVSGHIQLGLGGEVCVFLSPPKVAC
jgi:hypothetical protein